MSNFICLKFILVSLGKYFFWVHSLDRFVYIYYTVFLWTDSGYEESTFERLKTYLPRYFFYTKNLSSRHLRFYNLINIIGTVSFFRSSRFHVGPFIRR